MTCSSLLALLLSLLLLLSLSAMTDLFTHAILFDEQKTMTIKIQYDDLLTDKNINDKGDNISSTSNEVGFIVNSTLENITVKKDQEFTISLESNPTTGYQWIPTFNTSIINLISHNFQPSTTKLMGAPVMDIFKFKAINYGTDSLKMLYKRSWEKMFVKEKLFVINVI